MSLGILQRFLDFSQEYGELKEYSNLMKLLTQSRMNLVDLMDASDIFYAKCIKYIREGTRNNLISSLLTTCRSLISNGGAGTNVLRYLLYHLNNKIIKRQLSVNQCTELSNLLFKVSVYSF